MFYLSSRRHAGRHLARWRTANLFFFSYHRLSYQSARWYNNANICKTAAGPETQMSLPGASAPRKLEICRGLLPLIFGGAIFCTPCFNFGPGRIAPGRDRSRPLLLSAETFKNRVVRLIVRLLHTDPHLSCLQKTESVNWGMLLS